MNWTRARLKEMARTALHGSYWKSVLAALILTLIVGGGAFSTSSVSGSSSGVHFSYESNGFYDFGMYDDPFSSPYMGRFIAAAATAVIVVFIIAVLLDIFLFNPIEVGCRNYFWRDIFAPQGLDTLGVGFRSGYWNVVKTMFLKDLFNGLWYLLLIVPGIVKHYEYLMIPYILSENPDMNYKDAFAISKQMMDGEKWNAFVLDLSFLGWELLGALTLGILLIFYVNPYIYLTYGALYDALKQKYNQTGSGNAGSSYGPYNGGQGSGYGPYNGGTGSGYGPYSGGQGSGYGPYNGGQGSNYGPYNGGQGGNYGPYNGSYNGGAGNGYGTDNGNLGSSYGPQDGNRNGGNSGGFDV